MRAAYSPKMFRRQGAGAGSPMMVLATGSQDQKIAIWHEACARPKAIATKIFRCADEAKLHACLSGTQDRATDHKCCKRLS